MGKNKILSTYVLSISVWILAFLFALKLGVVSDADFDLIVGIRLPRVILAAAVGMGLSVAGAILQALFSNPLCEPYTLGISSGAALGTVIGISLGLEWAYAGLAGTGFLGAAVFAFILYLVTLRPGNGNVTLLLTGVMLGFLGNSLVALWMALSDLNGLQGAIVWFFGDLSRARLKGAIYTALGVSSLVWVIWRMWRDLDGLLLGEETASALGIDVGVVRRRIIFYSSLLIGLCVSAAGMIGFVGLVVPHLARRCVGSLHFNLIPVCGILGGIVLVLADTLSRVLAKPYELPVGVVTALIGAPVFLSIMLRGYQREK